MVTAWISAAGLQLHWPHCCGRWKWVVTCELDTENWPLYTGTELNLRDRVWVKWKRVALLLCQAKGPQQLMPSKLCVPTWGFCEESYSQGVGLLIRIMVPAGPAFLKSTDHLASGGFMMDFCDSGSCRTVTFIMEWRMLHQVVTIFHMVRVLVLQKSSKILLYVSLGAEPGSCPKTALFLLECSSLFSVSPPFPD